MTRNQSVRGQRWTCFAHYSNVLFDSCIDLWLRYQKKKEDTAAAKMVGEDVGEDRLHSVDLLLELMPHSYAVHSDWCKVIMVLAFSEVHFFYHCNPFLRSQEAEEAADAAGQKLHRRRQQKSLAPSAWKVERLEWWSFIITPSIMKARRQRAINRSITTLYRRRKAFFWAARKRQFWHDGEWRVDSLLDGWSPSPQLQKRATPAPSTSFAWDHCCLLQSFLVFSRLAWWQYHLLIVTDLWEDDQAHQAFRGWGRKASGKGWHLIPCFHKFLRAF